MLSSTSSSERAVPCQHWPRVWLPALVLVLAVLGSLEFGLRRAGYRPTVVDDKDFWSLHRRSVYQQDETTPVVLLGMSRMQLGFVPSELEKHYRHYRAVQLAIQAKHPWATFRDLALDRQFTGIVICSIIAPSFLEVNWEDQNSHVRYYRDSFNTNAAVNTWISCHIQNRLAFLNPWLRLDELPLFLLKDKPFPPPPYLRTSPDRSWRADYTMLDIEEHRRNRLQRIHTSDLDASTVSPKQWLEQATQIDRFTRMIQERGGKVVFVRFPTTDEHWAHDEARWPKALYWDAFARKTPATTIHFLDYPELSCFDCPDTSHLDYRDATVFTRSLLRILEERDILDRGE